MKKSKVFITLDDNKLLMKCSDLLRNLKKVGIKVERQGKGSHTILIRQDSSQFSFPNHRSDEMAKGLEMKVKKMGRIKIIPLL